MDLGEEATVVSATVATPGGPAAAVAVPTPASTIDEDLREASALGDVDRVAGLLAAGANVGSANRVNGWTALHWAAKRGHTPVVSLLLRHGADPLIHNLAGQSPADVATSDKTASLLGGCCGGIVVVSADRRSAPAATASAINACGGDQTAATAVAGEFVPNYLRNPEFPYAAKARRRRTSGGGGGERRGHSPSQQGRPLRLLLVRVANASDQDFIEVELRQPGSYEGLLDLVCQELGLEPDSVDRIRKLPNVHLRNDRDVGRLEDGQQLEIVLSQF